MGIWNTTRLSELKLIKDFTSEHYQIDRIVAENKLKSISSHKIGYYYLEDTSNIQTSKLDCNWLVYDLSDTLSTFLEGGINPIDENVSSNKKIARTGDFIISRLRHYLEEMAIVPENTKKIALSTEYLVFRSKGYVCNELLLAFSLSKYIQTILLWAQTGNEHPRFSSSTFKDIFLPDILVENSFYFEQIIQEAINSRKQSQALYQQATDLLEQELGLDKIIFEKPRSYTANFSEVLEACRMDGEHFTPMFNQLESLLIGKENVKTLKYMLSYCKRGKQPHYAESGLSVLNSKHIRENKVVFNDNRNATTPTSSNELIIKNDVLINGTGVGTIGRSAPYLEDYYSIPDNHVTILRSDIIDSCFLSVYLNSQAGQIQVNKYQRGSSGQIELYPHDIQKFLVWEAPKEIQKKIGDMVRKAYVMEKQSKQLIEEAKSRVEQLIEDAAKN